MNPTFFIGILAVEITQNPDCISRHRIVDTEAGENLLSDIEFTFVELPKLHKSETGLSSVIDQRVFFIKSAENVEVIPENVKDKGLIGAYEKADKHNPTKAELEAYAYVLMREHDGRGPLNSATRKAFYNQDLRLGGLAKHTHLTIEQVGKRNGK